MPKFLDAHDLVESGRYTSVHAVHRGVRNGELPKPTRYGRRFLWNEDRLAEHERAREGHTAWAPKKARKVIRR